MHRRTLVMTLAATLSASAAQAQMHGHADHAHAAPTGDSGRFAALVAAATTCVEAGLACQAHCLDRLAAGDTSMAACARAVMQMLAGCDSLVKLASLGSAHTASMARLALTLCQECETECRKHEQHHAVCKACADACRACAEACRKAAA